MQPSASRTYPLPLRRFLMSLEKEAQSSPMTSGSYLRPQSRKHKKRKKRKPNGHTAPGQLQLPLTKPTSFNKRKRDQMSNFTEILNRPSEEIKPPVTLPMGSYHTIVMGLPEQGQSSKKK